MSKEAEAYRTEFYFLGRLIISVGLKETIYSLPKSDTNPTGGIGCTVGGCEVKLVRKPDCYDPPYQVVTGGEGYDVVVDESSALDMSAVEFVAQVAAASARAVVSGRFP